MTIKYGYLIFAICVFVGFFMSCKNIRKGEPEIDISSLPRQLYWEEGAFHVQGVVVDVKRGFVYYSFTTSLIKTDLSGRFIGSVDGMTGHLGCIDIHPEDGRVYGSLEYKNDAIGRGITQQLDNEGQTGHTDAFYIAIFDVDKIIRRGMNAESDGVMATVYLKEVVDDYGASVENQGHTVAHRYGCSGIDGTAFGPQFGEKNGQYYLHVAYGIYGDTTRTDNDYQVILQYDVSDWQKYARPLKQSNPHREGPEKPLNKFFVFTGNTTYGIQNLAYDTHTGYWFAAAYKGRKSAYPNFPLFTIDGSQKPTLQPLKGFDDNCRGMTLQLAKAGIHHPETDLYGWHHQWGSTGIHALGHGYFYISQNGVTPDKKQYCKLRLYRWTAQSPDPFEEVE